MEFPKKVNIVEVGPRDGLQNEPTLVPTNVKIDLIDRLSNTGLQTIECSSFVSPKWIPQLQDAAEVMSSIKKDPLKKYPVLIPNLQGLTNAIQTPIDTIAIFASASEAFSKKNINCSIDESIRKMTQVASEAKQRNYKIRGYISCVLGCPYTGEVDIANTIKLAVKLEELGCYEVSFGDTIGVGTPLKAKALIKEVKKVLPLDKVAVHFHDTYGQALVNIYACLEEGVSTVDSSIAGLGGCPYARGSSGNVATEDVVYMLQGMGIETGVNLEELVDVAHFVTKHLGHPSRSKVSLAYVDKK
jgi:hydroxymethylglutaryl-CoA lyase